MSTTSRASPQFKDPDLVNAWGISTPPTGPFWVSDNGTSHVTLYSVIGGTVNKLGLTVTIPGDGSVTGQLFNRAQARAPSMGTISCLFLKMAQSLAGVMRWESPLRL